MIPRHNLDNGAAPARGSSEPPPRWPESERSLRSNGREQRAIAHAQRPEGEQRERPVRWSVGLDGCRYACALIT